MVINFDASFNILTIRIKLDLIILEKIIKVITVSYEKSNHDVIHVSLHSHGISKLLTLYFSKRIFCQHPNKTTTEINQSPIIAKLLKKSTVGAPLTDRLHFRTTHVYFFSSFKK